MLLISVVLFLPMALAHQHINVSCHDVFVAPGETAHTSCTLQDNDGKNGLAAVNCSRIDKTDRLYIYHKTTSRETVHANYEGNAIYIYIFWSLINSCVTRMMFYLYRTVQREL